MSLTTNNPIFFNSKSITNRNVRLTKDINDFLDFFLFSSETFNIFIKIYENHSATGKNGSLRHRKDMKREPNEAFWPCRVTFASQGSFLGDSYMCEQLC